MLHSTCHVSQGVWNIRSTDPQLPPAGMELGAGTSRQDTTLILRFYQRSWCLSA